MLSKPIVLFLGLLAPIHAETVLGVTVFSRHGDSKRSSLILNTFAKF